MCDDGFDTTAAHAICRQMNYTGATRWTTDESFDIQSDYDINLDDVDCSSAEWESCSFSENRNCGHSEDVFLSCTGDQYYFIIFSTAKFALSLRQGERGHFHGFRLLHK